jgi:hypothetical protein
MDLIENLTLPCPNDGDQKWVGDVFCRNCNAIYLCSGIEETDEINAKGEKIRKFVYPESPPKGMCTCGKRLLGGTEFTARPMCHLCAVRVTARNAAEKGEITWLQECPHGGVRYPENFNDYADPLGDHSFELWTFENGDHWNWEVEYPIGHCGGEARTQEKAREYATRVYALLTKLAEEKP